MKKWLPQFLMLLGSAILILGYLLAPGMALPRLVGFIIVTAGFVLRRRG